MRLSRSAISGLVVSSLVTLAGCGANSAPTERNETSLVGNDVEPSCPAPSAYAGRLDDTFGVNGMARVSFGAADDGAFFGLDVAGDRILAAGWAAGGLGGVRFRLARLTTSGRLDPTFGGSGTLGTGFSPAISDTSFAVAVGHQSDGGIVAMGHRDKFHGESANIALMRFEPDGSIGGSGFGTDGKSLIDLGGEESVADGLVLPNDKILVVGGRGSQEILIARATRTGALDTTFAAPKGYVTVPVGVSAHARSVALDASGRILVAGTADLDQGTIMVVLRLTADGVLDPSFGGDGVIEAGRDTNRERAESVAPSADGTIVVAGDTGGDNPDFVVRRFLADGSPDLSFGSEGRAEGPRHAGNMRAEDMVVLPGGGILVVGNSPENETIVSPVLVRYTCDGRVDTTFGVHGILRVYLGENGVLHTVRLHPGNRVLLGGADVGMTPGPGTYGVVVRMWM
ncbi:hypothetical protein [Polyangium jinanense]|uniref:Delta-60 repeat protein n=1 Tax=Polyangium jinanense TaxID=2829994 RepID=A0A9X3X4U9_9BACT|nr:hypothetical protein [Polyangium jinanense]MDC3954838.1 hypothetical protein [Polyangium jinanense]MDC3981391.1 hypothetical protein [Polyangium jinanense]